MPGTERRHRKKALKPAIKRELISYLTTQFAMSLRQACRTLSLSRTVYFYQPDTRRDEPVIHALTELAERYPRYGFKKLFQLLRRQGNTWNHKRVHRIYCLLKLNFRRKGKQRLPVRNPAPLATPQALNQSWSRWRWHNGPKNMACSSNLLNRVNLHKMLLSKGSTGHTGQKFWIFTCSEH